MKWAQWALLGALGLMAGDYIRRRVRAQKIYNTSQARVRQVQVDDVIERELDDKLSREQVLAQLPPVTRYLDQRRYEIARQWISATKRGGRFLDAGCGDGYVLQEMARAFPSHFEFFLGADISYYKCALARARLDERFGLNIANVEGLPYADSAFDVILCTEVLEHLLNVQPGVAELWRVCGKEGCLILSTPSKQAMFFSFYNPFTWFEALLGLFVPDALPPFHNLEKPGDAQSVVHRAFTIQELQNELRAFSGLTIRTCHFRLPGVFYRFVQSPRAYARIEEFLARVPLVNRLGQTLIVFAVK